jgi:NitT/TauT family transport system substrate-binding protein
MIRLPSGADILAQVTTGDIQVGGGALGAAGYNAIQGKLPVKFVAPMHMAYNEDYLTIRKQDYDQGKVTKIEDLKGKPCAVNAKGLVTEWQLYEMLRRGNLTIRDVDLKTIPFPEMVVGLETGAITAGIISEPFATSAESKGVGIRPWKARPGVKPFPLTMLFWNTTWAAKNNETARKFMIAYLKAIRDLCEKDAWRKPENMAVLQKYTKVEPEVLIKTRPPYFSPNLETDWKNLMDQQRFHFERGYLKYETLLPVETIVDFSYANYAVKKLGRW